MISEIEKQSEPYDNPGGIFSIENDSLHVDISNRDYISDHYFFWIKVRNDFEVFDYKFVDLMLEDSCLYEKIHLLTEEPLPVLVYYKEHGAYTEYTTVSLYS